MFSPVCWGPVVWGRCGSSHGASCTPFSAAVSSTPPLRPSRLQHEALSLPAGQLYPQRISDTQRQGWDALLLKSSHICIGPHFTKASLSQSQVYVLRSSLAPITFMWIGTNRKNLKEEQPSYTFCVFFFSPVVSFLCRAYLQKMAWSGWSAWYLTIL